MNQSPAGECKNTGCPEGCYWGHKTRGGLGLYVPQCKICGNINWDEIAEQLAKIRGRCPNLSYYGRPCTQAPHSPAQACTFAPDEDSEWYDLDNGSTMAELLEALTAGGTVAVSAAMRWLEYRLYSDHADAQRIYGDHMVTSVKKTALVIVQEEQKALLRYLSERAKVAETAEVGSVAVEHHPI